MSTYNVKVRNLASTWLSAIFCTLLVLFLGFVEFFQDTSYEKSQIDLTKSPIAKNFLKDIEKIELKNRIGTYTIHKDNKTWFLKEPRSMSAKIQTINLIREALNKIKILTFHKNDPINFQSFSLDKPTITIKLTNKSTIKTVKVGLINSIDNTSFVHIDSEDKIYQTAIVPGNLQALELSDFIDSRVFTIKNDQIKKLKIYRGSKISPLNNITQNNGSWKFSKYKQIDNAKVSRRLDQILKIPPHMIIDKNDPETNTVIENYLKNPNYKLEILSQSNETIKYQISYPVKSIPGLKLEKKQYFIIKASNRKFPFVVNKEYLNDFYIRYSEIRP